MLHYASHMRAVKLKHWEGFNTDNKQQKAGMSGLENRLAAHLFKSS